MAVRYDPVNHNKVILVASDRAGGAHKAKNLKLLGFFAAGSVLCSRLRAFGGSHPTPMPRW